MTLLPRIQTCRDRKKESLFCFQCSFVVEEWGSVKTGKGADHAYSRVSDAWGAGFGWGFISRVTPDAIIYTYLLLASTFFIQTPFFFLSF